MSARSQVTLWDQGGGVGEDVTEDQVGSPERLILVTSHPLATADLQILEPKNPFPPHTTNLLVADIFRYPDAILSFQSITKYRKNEV